ncbi:hypothetical protein Pint_20730 [Pistacia integerrima]|uniref:Uncharacterized protein n=1 Tax=Pistacia integerrima TaxID=434235 RepID=A0ACC0XCQ6_9ROSI|nr:hypothetical protein Pint_20730 [Pistacia integerrima]
MGTLGFVSQHKKYLIFFLNVSFLLVGSVILLVTYFTSSEFLVSSSFGNNQQDCKVLEKLDGYKAKCLYLKSGNRCVSQGYIDYLYLFYCSFGRFPFLGYFLIFLWLLVLFYLLGNTASEYFCSSLESLSRLLDLSPTIAGVTLLSLGNGAPDVFASLVSFMGSGTSDIGLNTVLGAASFVTCVVVGTICICLHKRSVRVNKYAFIRDVCFFLLVLASLVVILIRGKINLWGAIGFSSMYVVYVVIVYLSVICYHISGEESETEESSSYVGDLSVPILTEKRNLEDVTSAETSNCFFCNMILYILEMPLYLPRRLTIPVVCEKKWSKPIAVTSVTLSPILVAALWNPESLMVSGIGLLTGFALGVLAFFNNREIKPSKILPIPLAGRRILNEYGLELHHSSRIGGLVGFSWVHFGHKPFTSGAHSPRLGQFTWRFDHKFNNVFEWRIPRGTGCNFRVLCRANLQHCVWAGLVSCWVLLERLSIINGDPGRPISLGDIGVFSGGIGVGTCGFAMERDEA